MDRQKFRDKEASVSHIYIVLDFEIYNACITKKNQNILKGHTMDTQKFGEKEASVCHIYIVLDFEIYCACITNKN